ncbi:MAG: hypothetical protein WKF73_02275 [Nocardioidaceae bacterium]
MSFAEPANHNRRPCHAPTTTAPTRSRIPAPTGGIDLAGDVYAVFALAGAPRQLIPVHLVHPSFS